MKQIAAVELERCVVLADFLDTVPEKDFNLRSWVIHTPKPRKTALFGMIEIHPGCGFAGCAMGWAAYEGVFPGFYAKSDGTIVYENGRKPRTKHWEAVRDLLGIKIATAEWLFYPSGYKVHATPAMVAERVRRFANKITAIRARDRRRVVVEQPKLELVYHARVPRRSRAERPQLELTS